MKLIVVLCLVAIGVRSERFEKIGDDISQFAAELMDFNDELKGHIDNADERHREIQWYNARINGITSTGCDDVFQLQCGGDKPKCISRLLICDNIMDCPSGADEAQCQIFTPVGSKWKAEFYYDVCTKLKPKEMFFTITAYKVPIELLSFPEVKAEAYASANRDDFSYSHNFMLDGVMDLKVGEHRLYFHPPESDGLALECIFDGVHDNYCHGKILYASSQKACAFFFMKKID